MRKQINNSPFVIVQTNDDINLDFISAQSFVSIPFLFQIRLGNVILVQKNRLA